LTETGLGLKELSNNIGETFGRQIAAAVLGLVTTAIIARVYGPEGSGILAVALLLPSMLSTFLNLGIAPANVYYLGSSQITPRQLLVTNLLIFLPLVTLGLGIGAAVLAWKAKDFFPGIAPSVLWLALSAFPLALLNSFMLSIFQGLQQFRPFNFIAIASPFVFLVIVIGLTIGRNQEIALLVGAQIISQIIMMIITIRLLFTLPLGHANSKYKVESFLKKTLSYGWKAHLSNILAFVNYKADIFIANLFLGPSAVGVYVIAVAMVEKLWLFSHAVSTVLLPRLSQLSSEEDKRRRLTPIVCRWVLVTTFFAALVLAAVGGYVISSIFGPDFDAALLPLWILLPGIVLTSASRILANDIAARGRPDLNMYASIVIVLVNVVGNLILIPTYGLPGAATATTIAYALDVVLRLIIYGRFSGNRWVDSIFPHSSDLRFLNLAFHRQPR